MEETVDRSNDCPELMHTEPSREGALICLSAFPARKNSTMNFYDALRTLCEANTQSPTVNASYRDDAPQEEYMNTSFRYDAMKYGTRPTLMSSALEKPQPFMADVTSRMHVFTSGVAPKT